MNPFQKRQDKSTLSAQAILLLSVNGFFAAANALSGTFVNVYLWKMKNDFAVIGWFAFANQLTMAATFWLAGKWVKEYNKMNCLRLGVAVNALFYLFVLLLQEQAVRYVIPLGIIQGLSAGFFWLAFNVVYFEVTDPENRDKFNGWAGLLGSGAGMLAPWISAFLITHTNQINGYRLIFSISLAVFLIGMIFSFFLKKRKMKGTYHWVIGFRRMKEPENPWRLAFPALIAQGIREGVFGFLIGLMVYIVTQNEMNVGNYSLITSAVALFSFWVVGKWLKPKHRKPGMLIGTVMILAAIMPFFWRLDYFTLLVFGVGVALFIPLYIVPMTSSVFDLIGLDEESARQRVEFIVLRELALNAGRMLGTLIFIVVVSRTSAPLAMNLLLLGIGSSPLIAWLFIKNLLTRRFAVEENIKTR